MSTLKEYFVRKEAEFKDKLKERRERIAMAILSGIYSTIDLSKIEDVSGDFDELSMIAITQANSLIKILDYEE